MRVVLVRHGQSTWNAAGLLQGIRPGIPLTDRGRVDAAAVAVRLAGRPIDAVWSSDLLRACQTAEPIAARHRLPIRSSPLLREQCHGAWEGRPFEECEPAILAAGPDWAPPGGETARQVYGRATRFLQVLRAQAGEQVGTRVAAPGAVVVVSHGEVIRALVAVMSGRTVDALPDRLPGTGTTTELELGPTSVGRRPPKAGALAAADRDVVG